MTVTHHILLPVLLFLSVCCLASSKVKKCEKIKIPMCQGIGYNLTYMPNMFNHDTQEEAALEIHQFWPLVEIKCSPDLKFFLCSMYAPMCKPNFKEEVPPCRSLCKRAKNGCAPLMRQYGFSWPKRMRCRNFPKAGGDRLCLKSDGVAAKQMTTTARPTKISNGKRCEKIKIPMCQSIGYNLTSMPNMFYHDTQGDAALEVHQFLPLVKVNCSPDLTFFLCSMYAPMCQPNFKGEVLPCRSICERARKGCAPVLRRFGFSWPERMKCEIFPEDEDNRLCLGRDGVAAKQMTTTARPTELISITKISNGKRCEKIKIPMCQSIGYNLTYMPNMFHHDTQEDAALEIYQFWPFIEINCSPDLKFFLCSMYAPICQSNFKEEVLPCRSICERARKGCASRMPKYGINSWPERMKCEIFPEEGGNRLCLGSDRAVANRTTTPTALIAKTKTSKEKK